MWVHCFRRDRHLFATTNNGVESMNSIFKHKVLSKKGNYSLSVMLKFVVEKFIPDQMSRYAAENTIAISNMQKVSASRIPAFLRQKMPMFRKACMPHFIKGQEEFNPEMVCRVDPRTKIWMVYIKLQFLQPPVSERRTAAGLISNANFYFYFSTGAVHCS